MVRLLVSKGRKRPRMTSKVLLTSVKLIFSPLNMRSRAASTPLDLAWEEKTLRPGPTHAGHQRSKLPSTRLGAAPSGADRWLQPGALPHCLGRVCSEPEPGPGARALVWHASS